MKIKALIKMIGLFTLLAALAASQTGALAAAPMQDTGPSATIQIERSSTLAADTALKVGDTVTLAVSLQNIPAGGFTSAEFACRYDPVLAELSNFTDAGLFGTGAAATLNGPLGGTFIYAIAGAGSNKATTSGTVFRFNMKALKAGSFVFDCQVRASTGASLISVAFTPATITITDPTANGTLTGKVIASKPVTVTLLSGTTKIATVAAAADGTFSISAAPATYTITASAAGFLTAQGSATITGGATSSLPTTTLVAGDIDGNGKIDSLDVATIGINYNKATPTAADFNNDGIINLLDLQILAKNYPKTGPTAW